MDMPITIRKGVTELSNEKTEYNRLMEEFESTLKAFKEVLEDLEWRKPDVEAEEAKLKQLMDQARTDPGVDVASQRIVVRVLRDILDEKLRLADALENRITILRGQLEALEKEKAKLEEAAGSGKTIHKKKKRLG
jgi:chromosome segregation ATPase